MGQVLQRGTQMEEDLGVHLRDPRLRYVQYDANLSHGEFLIIVTNGVSILHTIQLY